MPSLGSLGFIFLITFLFTSPSPDRKNSYRCWEISNISFETDHIHVNKYGIVWIPNDHVVSRKFQSARSNVSSRGHEGNLGIREEERRNRQRGLEKYFTCCLVISLHILWANIAIPREQKTPPSINVRKFFITNMVSVQRNRLMEEEELEPNNEEKIPRYNVTFTLYPRDARRKKQ